MTVAYKTFSRPNQLFMPHIYIVDFVVWPAFRELTVQIRTMQERMEWLMNMSKTVQCDWSFLTDEALVKDEETGLLDLCPVAKVRFSYGDTTTRLRRMLTDSKRTMLDLANWSVAPSFRGFVSNADSYVRIRTDDY